MKKIAAIAIAIFCIIAGAYAQKQGDPLPYNKQYLDSLFRNWPKLNQPFVLPVPKGYTPPVNLSSENQASFEAANPGAAVINKTTRGIIYNMPLDNMAVLVPDMNQVENMPGSYHSYRVAPKSNMPNPLYRPKKLPSTSK